MNCVVAWRGPRLTFLPRKSFPEPAVTSKRRFEVAFDAECLIPAKEQYMTTLTVSTEMGAKQEVCVFELDATMGLLPALTGLAAPQRVCERSSKKRSYPIPPRAVTVDLPTLLKGPMGLSANKKAVPINTTPRLWKSCHRQVKTQCPFAGFQLWHQRNNKA
ncbi:hypothetical protein NDU88_000854 [Pleurodeles waltl]|uniref:Uncharacterized protein n=1 Tax=Pleurodeles waltl TaxID=8319 RepID=A0AAV7UR65_PLEWA|nr:hypothetical protein NDU88_000854 [Pleurodeles waltl]